MLQISFLLWYCTHPTNYGILIFHDVSCNYIVLSILYNIICCNVCLYFYYWFFLWLLCRWGFPQIFLWPILFDINTLNSIKIWPVMWYILVCIEECVFYYCHVWCSQHVTLVKWSCLLYHYCFVSGYCQVPRVVLNL